MIRRTIILGSLLILLTAVPIRNVFAMLPDFSHCSYQEHKTIGMYLYGDCSIYNDNLVTDAWDEWYDETHFPGEWYEWSEINMPGPFISFINRVRWQLDNIFYAILLIVIIVLIRKKYFKKKPRSSSKTEHPDKSNNQAQPA